MAERERKFAYVGPVSPETRRELIDRGRRWGASEQDINDYLVDRTGEGLST